MALIISRDMAVIRPYKVFRSFWPVGQGAFYSELFTVKIDGKKGYSTDALVVYDCGSNDKDELVDNCISKLEKRAQERKIIDALFISHFHSDHISRISHLIQDWDVRLIILPVISPAVLIDAYLQNYVRYGQQSPDPQTIQLLQKLLSEQKIGDAKIVHVSPASDDDAPGSSDKLQNTIDALLRDENTIIRSGYSISIGLWEYIPCNYPTNKASNLVDALKTRYPDLYDAFLQNDWGGIRFQLSHIPFDEIVALYDDQYSNPNEESMTVLSHPLVKTDPQKKATCLYTGDSPFRTKKRLNFIKDFYKPYWKDIGTIQVSHHGCEIDNPEDLYDHSVTGVMCYGTNNSYGHPGMGTFINIAIPKGNARIVTENTPDPYLQSFTFI